MREPFNNNSVRINNSNDEEGMRRNFVYTNSNTNENNVGQPRPRVITQNNLRRMRRARMSFVNVGPVRRLNFGNNGNKRPNASNYTKNEKRMKKNANENNNTNKITWKNVNMKNLPVDPISLENFKNGQKAVKINKLYLTPNSFRKMARMSMKSAINTNGNTVLFVNPFTRGRVKKSDLKFVVLKTKK
jgi:hypothetical protein